MIFERSADAYGNTLIFTAPDTTGNRWGDAAVQFDNGANEIIFCGYRFDPESQLYYVRNRTYNPLLGRWIERDPIGYDGGINLYEYLDCAPVAKVDWVGSHPDYSTSQPKLYLPRGHFTVTMSIPDSTSVTVQVNYNVPIEMNRPPCRCKEIAIVQYVKDAWSAGDGAIFLKGVQYQRDGGWPYGKGDKKMSQPWVYPSGNIAVLYDNPSLAVFGNGPP